MDACLDTLPAEHVAEPVAVVGAHDVDVIDVPAPGRAFGIRTVSGSSAAAYHSATWRRRSVHASRWRNFTRRMAPWMPSIR